MNCFLSWILYKVYLVLHKFNMLQQYGSPRWNVIILTYMLEFDILRKISVIVKIGICLLRTTSEYKITPKVASVKSLFQTQNDLKYEVWSTNK